MSNFDTDRKYVLRNIEDQLEILDTLPPAVRRALTYAGLPVDTLAAQRALQNGRSEAEVIALIELSVREHICAEALRLYGPTHPQAAA